MTQMKTDYAVAPGEYIEEWLEDEGMTQTEAAKRLGISRKHVNRVIAGARLTEDLAQALEIVTGTPARRWLQIEAQYRADVQRLALEDRLARRTDLVDAVAKLAPALRKEGIVTATKRTPGKLIIEIMTFFRVADPDELSARFARPLASFRQSTAHAADGASVAGWLRLGELALSEVISDVPDFDPKGLAGALDELRAISAGPPMDAVAALVQRLQELGVLLIFVPPVEGCRAYGATRWFGDKPVIQLSLRGKDDGQLWFTIFHELGHVLLHPRIEFVEGFGDSSDQEAAADLFARTKLIPDNSVHLLQGLTSEADVRATAKTLGVAPGIVLGRLHKDEMWPWSRGQKLYSRYKFMSDDDT